MTTRLTGIKTDEVSLVGKGANRKRFLLFKSKEGIMEELLKELLEEVKALEGEDKIVAAFKKAEMSEGEVIQAQAALRLLSAIADKVKKSGVVLEPFKADPPKVDASSTAEYLKSKEGRDAVAKALDISPDKFAAAFEKDPPKGDDLLKADGTLNEEKVPEALRPALSLLFKSKAETDEQLKKANEKIEKAEKAEKRTAMLKKAEEFKDVPNVDVNELTDTLLKLDEEDQEKILKPLRASKEAIEKGGLFSEFGKGGPGLPVGSAIEKVNTLAQKLIQKNDKLSEPDAIAQVLNENPQLLAEYQKETTVRA